MERDKELPLRGTFPGLGFFHAIHDHTMKLPLSIRI